MPLSPRPTLLRTWPALAASIAALAGMSSCIATAVPLTVFGAPLVGVGVAALFFSFFLALSPAAPEEREQRDRIRFAAAIAWMVSVATCWRFAGAMRGGTDDASRMYDGTMGQIAISGGAIVGLGVAWIIMRIGMAQYRRQAIAPGTDTIAARMGIEHLLEPPPPPTLSGGADPRRSIRSLAGWVVAIALGGYLGHLLASYWRLIGLAPRDSVVVEAATLVGALAGAAATFVIRRYDASEAARREVPQSARG